jgi:hypothetical protein
MGVPKVLHPPRPERKLLEALTFRSIGLLAKLNSADVHKRMENIKPIHCEIARKFFVSFLEFELPCASTPYVLAIVDDGYEYPFSAPSSDITYQGRCFFCKVPLPWESNKEDNRNGIVFFSISRMLNSLHNNH